MLKMKQVTVEKVIPLREEVFGSYFEDVPDSLHVLASADGFDVGCVSLVKLNDCFEVYGLGVRKDFRGNMIGEALLKMAEFLSLNRGCKNVFCDRQSGDAFLLKFGYKEENGKLRKTLSDSGCCSCK